MNDGKPGYRFEAAASLIARDTIEKHLSVFAHVISEDRIAGQAVVAAYIDGLAGAAALVIAGQREPRDEVLKEIVKKLGEAIDRDLRHLGRP